MSSFPITITSDYAEIIYFLRNGNLYRRVLLILPELQSSIMPMIANSSAQAGVPVEVNTTTPVYTFQPTSLNGSPANPVSWQGVNDLSARPVSHRQVDQPDHPEHPHRSGQPREPGVLSAVRQ